jgi:hypothetical protein
VSQLELWLQELKFLFPFVCWSLHKAHEAERHDSGKFDSALLFKLAQMVVKIHDQVLGLRETYVVLMFLNS